MILPKRTLLIAGKNKYDDVIWGTLKIEQNLTYIMDTCQFQLKHYQPVEGEEVIIEDETIGRLFAGIITKVELVRPFPTNQIIKIWQVDCNDYTELIDRRLVVEAYEDMSASNIFMDLAIKYCPGFTTENIQSGAPVVESTGTEFEYKRPSECFKWLCDYCGWHWQVDYYRGLHFFSVEELATPAPMVLFPDSDFRFGRHSVDKQGLRNRVYVRGGSMLSDPQLIQWKSDGVERIWVLPWGPHEIDFEVNEISQTVGVENLHDEADFDYMMSFTEKYIRCSEQTETPVAGVTMALTARQDIPVITMVEDYKSQSAVKAIQGGDGVYEHVIADDTLISIAAAEAAGMADLREHANPRVKGSFETEFVPSLAHIEPFFKDDFSDPEKSGTAWVIGKHGGNGTVDFLDNKCIMTPEQTEINSVSIRRNELFKSVKVKAKLSPDTQDNPTRYFDISIGTGVVIDEDGNFEKLWHQHLAYGYTLYTQTEASETGMGFRKFTGVGIKAETLGNIEAPQDWTTEYHEYEIQIHENGVRVLIDGEVKRYFSDTTYRYGNIFISQGEYDTGAGAIAHVESVCAEKVIQHSPPWQPGQIVDIRLPDRGVEGEFLIQRVVVAPTSPSRWTFSIEYGGRLLGIADFLQALVSSHQKRRHIEPTQNIQKYVYGEETLELEDELSTTPRSLPYICGDSDAICGMVVVFDG